MGSFDEVKNNPTTLLIYQKCLWQSLKLFSSFITFLKREIMIILSTSLKFPVGKSSKF